MGIDIHMKEMALKADGKRHGNNKTSLSDAEIMTICKVSIPALSDAYSIIISTT